MTTIARDERAATTGLATRERAPGAGGGIEYRALHALVFVTCLALAALLRLLPRRWHPWIGPAERPMSLVAEARAAADSTVPYVFQVS